jgi:hypothetical protein
MAPRGRDGRHEGPASATPQRLTSTFCTLTVERVVTDNAPDGQMWPPALGDRWVVAREFDDGRTLWRRITLTTDN